jgi:hypothetical protein
MDKIDWTFCLLPDQLPKNNTIVLKVLKHRERRPGEQPLLVSFDYSRGIFSDITHQTKGDG